VEESIVNEAVIRSSKKELFDFVAMKSMKNQLHVRNTANTVVKSARLRVSQIMPNYEQGIFPMIT
jgi:hypothetical protein